MQKFHIRCLILVAVLVIFSVLFLFTQYRTPQAWPQVDISDIPLKIGEWQGKEIEVNQNTKDILETDAVLMREYTNSKGDRIALAVVYYKDSRVALHLPESCLMGQGSRLTERNATPIILSNGTKFNAMQIITKSSSANFIMIYYFQTRDYMTASYFNFRKRMLLDRIRNKSASGALVRFSIDTKLDEMDKKNQILKEFIGAIGLIITQYLS